MYEIERLPQNIDIGYTGEQDFRTIEIDMSAWVAKVPDGQPILMHIRPGESEPYPVEITFEDNILTWSVSDEDLGTKEGTGLLQVWFGVEDEEQVIRQLGMSAVVATIVHLSLAGEGNNSSTVQIPWLKEVMEMKNIILGYDYEAESWAVGKRGGTDVPSTDPAYHNNAKYFSEQASAAKTAAEAAQEAAETAAERDVEAWLEENFTNPDSPPLDRTLALNTCAAPADMVGNLKSALNTAIIDTYPLSNNLIDSTFVLEPFEQGEYGSSAPHEISSPYIEVVGSSTIYCSLSNSYGKTLYVYCRAYDSSKTQIKNHSLVCNTDGNTYSFTLDADAKYIRICISTGNYSSTLTPESFKEANGKLYFGYKNIPNADTLPKYIPANYEIERLDQKIDDSMLSIKDVESIAANGYKTLAELPSGTTYNWSNTSTALSPDVKISNAYKLIKCSLNVATAGRFKVGLYTVSDTTATVTHVKEITGIETGETEFEIDFDLDQTKEYYFFVLAVTGAFKYAVSAKSNKYYTIPSSAVSVGGTGTVTTASGNGLAIGTFNVLLNVSVSAGIANVVTVAKSGGDYQTIQEAVNNTTTETIIVYPGIYDEVVVVPNSGGRNIIGVDREKCIIRSQSGKYAEAPLKIYGNFYLANMTLIATAEDAGTWYPTWDSSDPTTFASYAIHIEGWTNDWNGAKGIVRNCTFYSECNHAAGCGVQRGYTLEFENCEFVRNVTDSNYLNSNYDGAMGVHSPNVDATGETGEHLIMRDCTVINKNQTKALQLFYVFLDASMDAEIKGCTFKDSAGIDNVIKFWNCSNAMFTNMSHGNSTDECNYRAIHA